MWWQQGVIYQVYPRSFQDADGDGVGDLRGIASRLDHLTDLGVAGLWLSPIYPSPLADFGYDVSDHTAVDPVFGSLDDFDALVAAAHERGLRVLMDLVPCHTSIEHPWFREHPDWYIWADPRDGGPPNNWLSAFGGPAWSPDPGGSGRWYLHSFYPEQPDLDWRNPEVVEAMQGVVRFWFERGIDGFRVDAIDRIMKDPELRDAPPATEPFGLPLTDEEAKLARVYNVNHPDIELALAALRDAAGEGLLVGEVYLPTGLLEPYLRHLDLAFVFELLHSAWEPAALQAALRHGAVLAGTRGPGAAWVMSNHDFGRLPSRFGRANERVAAMLLLTLPGTSFIYQGDEIGLANGPGHEPPYDRAGRDRYRHPMQWDGSPTGGFTRGEPWLPAVDPAERNVTDQRCDPASLLSLYRDLIALRPRLGEDLGLVDAEPGVLAYRRGGHIVVLNVTNHARPSPEAGEIVLATDSRTGRLTELAPHSGAVVRATGF